MGKDLERYYWGPVKDKPKDRLNWIFDFILKDFHGLEGAEEIKLVFEMERYIFFRKLIKNPPKKMLEIVDTKETTLEELKLLSSEMREKLRTIQTEFKKTIQSISPIFSNTEVVSLSLEYPITYSIVPTDHTWKGGLLIMEETKSIRDKVICTILSLLKEIPLSLIKKCEECRKYFVTRRKTARFCSPNCNWIANSRKTREADPEAYRKKQRGIMKQRYDKKRTESLGVNVKIGTRKRKKP
ncbi:MAG: hypothetical protein V2A69_11470 [Pseudomonadota bacterium]